LVPADAWTFTLLVVLTVFAVVAEMGVAETVVMLLGAAITVMGVVEFWVVVVTVLGLGVEVALP
jgi:hypothetical protein